MLDRQQDQSTMHEEPEVSRLMAQFAEATPSIPFRLTADFVVEAKTAERYLLQPNTTSEERRLFLTVLTTPEALQRMCRLAIVSDFETKPGLFEGQFSGPQNEDILAAAIQYLSSEDQDYWTRLQQEFPAQMGDRLVDMFCEFKAVLRRVVVEDATTGEAIPLKTRRDRVL